MSDLQCSPALVARGDVYIGGVNWTKGHPLHIPKQLIISLTEKENAVLGVPGRCERLAIVGGDGARSFMLPPENIGGNPRLLLHGSKSSISAMQKELDVMLGKEGARIVPIHPYDTGTLRKPSRRFIADIETKTGCRMVMEDQRKDRLPEPLTTPRRHRVHLLGDPTAQARALGLISPALQHTDAPIQGTTLTTDYEKACEDWLAWKNSQESNLDPLETFFTRGPDVVDHSDMGHLCELHFTHNDNRDLISGGPSGFFGFDSSLTGDGLAISDDNLIKRARIRQIWTPNGRERAPLQGLVAASKGHILPYMVGSFFAMQVLKMDLERKSRLRVKRGGTRLGVTTVQPSAPVPATLLSKPKESWVLGRGFARGRDGKTARLEVADIDCLVSEKDELGVLVTRGEGDVALFRRPNRHSEWQCLVRWAAKVSKPERCFALLELSGAIIDVRLLHNIEPPCSVERDVDSVRLP